MTREEYIKNNKYIQKAMKNLDQKDLEYLMYVAENNIQLKSDDLRLKQLFFHMSRGIKVWELRPLLQSFKVLMTLDVSDK